MVWMYVSTPAKFLSWSLITTVTVLRGEGFTRSQALMNGISKLGKRNRGLCIPFALCLGLSKMQQQDLILGAQRTALNRSGSSSALILALPGSSTVRENSYCLYFTYSVLFCYSSRNRLRYCIIQRGIVEGLTWFLFVLCCCLVHVCF